MAPMVPVLSGIFVITAHVLTGNDITATQVWFMYISRRKKPSSILYK
jgi:hypothetical protein